jgi:hypothetical protein
MRIMMLKKIAAAACVVALLLLFIGAGVLVAQLASSPRTVVAASNAGPATTPANESLDQVIDRHIEARGGREKLATIKSVRMSGPLDLGPGGTAQLITEQRRPNGFRQDFIFNDQPNSRAYDGKIGWSHIPFMGIPKPTPMPADELKSIIEEADIDGPLVDYQRKGHKVELLGREPIDGRECYHLKVTLKNGDVRHHFIDAETMQLARVEGKQVEQGQEISYVQTLRDFRDVNAVMFPFQSEVEQSSPAGAQRFVYHIEKIETNVPMDDAHFAMPATQPATKP